jgi:hypothetical protein
MSSPEKEEYEEAFWRLVEEERKHREATDENRST